MIAYQLLRLALHAMSSVFGGIGVFAVYMSFRQPSDGVTAILALGTAMAMQRALEWRKPR